MDYPIKIIPNPRPLFYFKKAHKREYEQILYIINKLYPHKAIHILDIAHIMDIPAGGSSLALYIRDARVKNQLADEIITVNKMSPVEPLYFPYYQLDVNDKNQFEQLVNDYKGYFDIILGINSIEYVDNPKLYLYYLKEMLHDEGHLFISMCNINNPTTRRIFYKKGILDQFFNSYKNILLPDTLVSLALPFLNLMIEYPLGLYPKFWLYPSKKCLYTTLCNLRMLRFRGSLLKLYIFKKCI
jgi:2-polyprenyl-3-methyl-5-hydroxy-6-metoxy-1,4-benzoquinol methylase